MEQVIIVKQTWTAVRKDRDTVRMNVTDSDELNDMLRKGWRVKNITPISEDPLEVMVVLENDE